MSVSVVFQGAIPVVIVCSKSKSVALLPVKHEGRVVENLSAR
jgi:hypothetical protein